MKPLRFLSSEGRTEDSHRDKPTDTDRLRGEVGSGVECLTWPTSKTPALPSSLTSGKTSTSSSSSLGQLCPELTACRPRLGSTTSAPSGSVGLWVFSCPEFSSGLSSLTCTAVGGVSAMFGAASPGSPPWPRVQFCQAGSVHGSMAPGLPGRRRVVSCSMVLPRGTRTQAGGHHPSKRGHWQGSCQARPFPL
jgi:hypothetical protein